MRKHHKLYIRHAGKKRNPSRQRDMYASEDVYDKLFSWSDSPKIDIHVFLDGVSPKVSAASGVSRAYYVELIGKGKAPIATSKRAGRAGPFPSAKTALDFGKSLASMNDGILTAAAAKNPAGRSRIASKAKAYIAKTNPDNADIVGDAVSSAAGAAADVAGRVWPFGSKKKISSKGIEMEKDLGSVGKGMGLPQDPADAGRYMFYWGVLKGMELCGIKNWNKRRVLTNEINDKIIETANRTAAELMSGGRVATVQQQRRHQL